MTEPQFIARDEAMRLSGIEAERWAALMDALSKQPTSYFRQLARADAGVRRFAQGVYPDPRRAAAARWYTQHERAKS